MIHSRYSITISEKNHILSRSKARYIFIGLLFVLHPIKLGKPLPRIPFNPRQMASWWVCFYFLLIKVNVRRSRSFWYLLLGTILDQVVLLLVIKLVYLLHTTLTWKKYNKFDPETLIGPHLFSHVSHWYSWCMKYISPHQNLMGYSRVAFWKGKNRFTIAVNTLIKFKHLQQITLDSSWRGSFNFINRLALRSGEIMYSVASVHRPFVCPTSHGWTF